MGGRWGARGCRLCGTGTVLVGRGVEGCRVAGKGCEWEWWYTLHGSAGSLGC